MEWWRCFLFVGLLAARTSQHTFSLTTCNGQGTVDFVEGQAASITCTGLVPEHNINWTISSRAPNKAGECSTCDYIPFCLPYPCFNCNQACSPTTSDYIITRRKQSTTLHFKTVYQKDDGAVVKCSSNNNVSKALCTINVFKAYAIQGCVNGELEVVRKNMDIRCAGLDPSQNMYWAITDTSRDNTGIIAECAFCPHGGPCPACTLRNTEFSVTRSGHFSDLRIVSGAHQKNGSRLICTKQDLATFDHCKIRVNYYNLPQCKLETLEISEVQPATSILCEGLQSADNVIWMIRNTTGSSEQLAFCGTQSVDYACNVTNPDTFYASRNVSVSQLTIKNSIRETLDNRTVACIRLDRFKSDSCRIRVVQKPGTPLLEAQTCPVIVAEGSSLECKCHHAETEQGSPPAFVSWLKDDNYSVLNISNVNRGQNGTEYTCRSVWGPTAALTQIVNYTLLVAYGPTSANVTSQKNLANMTDTLTLTCTSDEVYPSANFSWSVPCLTLDLTSLVSTCEVATGTLIQVTEVTCTAYNSEIPSLTTSAAYKPPAANEEESSSKGGNLPLAYVAGGTAAAVAVVVAVIVVIIVITLKRRNRTYERPRRRINKGEDPHTYSDLQPGAITGSPTPPNTADSSNSNLQPNNPTNNVRNRSVTKEGRENGGDHVCDGARSGNQDVQKPNIVYLNVRSSQGSDAAAYYNATGDVQAAHSDDGDNDHYYSQVKDVESAGPDIDSSDRTYERPRRRRNREEDPHTYSDLQPGAITGSPTQPNTADSSDSNLQPNNPTNNVRNRSVTKEGRENGGDNVCDGARTGNQDVQKPNIVYLNVRSSQGSDAAAYYNATGDVQAAHSDDGVNDHYYSQVKDVESAGPDLDSSDKSLQ